MRHPTDKEVRALRILSAHTDGLFGLDLVRKSDKAISRGSVYFILDRMEQQGWVDFRPEHPPPGYGGKPRNIYTINALGHRVLDYVVGFDGMGASAS